MINYVTTKEIDKVIDGEDTRQEWFITKDDDKYIAVDNTTGDAWTEEFFTLTAAVIWLQRG